MPTAATDHIATATRLLLARNHYVSVVRSQWHGRGRCPEEDALQLLAINALREYGLAPEWLPRLFA